MANEMILSDIFIDEKNKEVKIKDNTGKRVAMFFGFIGFIGLIFVIFFLLTTHISSVAGAVFLFITFLVSLFFIVKIIID